jgi:hypothetical protein
MSCYSFITLQAIPPYRAFFLQRGTIQELATVHIQLWSGGGMSSLEPLKSGSPNDLVVFG